MTARRALFDPSYTSDGLSPLPPWGRTRHALNPAIPALIDGFAAESLDPIRAQTEINEIARSYGEMLHEHGVPRACVVLAGAALRHAFDDTAEWVVRRRAIEPMLAAAILSRVARLAEDAVDVVHRSYDEQERYLGRPARHAPRGPGPLDLLAFAVAAERDHGVGGGMSQEVD